MASLQQWQQDLRNFGQLFDSGDLMPALLAADAAVAEGFADNFNNKVDETGAAWPPHAPSTVARYGPHPLLVLSGMMKAAAVNPSHPGHVRRQISPESMLVGISGVLVPYAIYHHTGTSKMPRRRVIYLSDASKAKVSDRFAAAVRSIIRLP